MKNSNLLNISPMNIAENIRLYCNEIITLASNSLELRDAVLICKDRQKQIFKCETENVFRKSSDFRQKTRK